MSDDSDAERDRQLSHLYSEMNQNGAKDEKWKTIAITDKREELLPNNNQKIPIDKKDADGIEKTETTTKECTRHSESVKKNTFSGSVGDAPQKSLKQNSITQYFEKYSNKTPKIKCTTDETHTVEEMEAGKENNGVMLGEMATDTKNKLKKPRKASMAANYPSTSGTPRTPRRLPFRLETNKCQTPTVEQYDKDSFFHTPQHRSKIPKNMRQTPSKTAPALVRRRRSAKLQERFAALRFEELRDQKVHVVTTEFPRPNCETRAMRGKKRNQTSIFNEVKCDTNAADHSHIEKRRGRPRKNRNENSGRKRARRASKTTYDKGKQNGQGNDVITPVKFYGTKSTTSKLQGSTAKLNAKKDTEHKIRDVKFSEMSETVGPIKAKYTKIESSDLKGTKRDNAKRTNYGAESTKGEKRKICKTVGFSHLDPNTASTKTNVENNTKGKQTKSFNTENNNSFIV